MTSDQKRQRNDRDGRNDDEPGEERTEARGDIGQAGGNEACRAGETEAARRSIALHCSKNGLHLLLPADRARIALCRILSPIDTRLQSPAAARVTLRRVELLKTQSPDRPELVKCQHP